MNPAFLFEFVPRGRRINAIEDLVRTVKKVIYEFIINYIGLFKKPVLHQDRYVKKHVCFLNLIFNLNEFCLISYNNPTCWDLNYRSSGKGKENNGLSTPHCIESHYIREKVTCVLYR